LPLNLLPTRRRFLSLSATAAGTAALVGCGASIEAVGERPPAEGFTGGYQGPPVELSFWNPFTGGDGPTMQKIVDAFNAAHDTISVRTTSLAADDLYAKLLPAVGSAQGPHVSIIHLDQLPTFALRGTLLPLDDVVDGLGITEQDFIPNAFGQAVYRDRRWGLPLDLFSSAQFWNTDLYAAAGIPGPVSDAASFEEAMTALQGIGVEAPLRVAPGNWQLYVSLLAQFGGTLFDESGERATFGSEAGVEALAWMRSVVDRGFSPAGTTDTRAPLKNGSAALVSDLPAFVPDLQDTAPDLPWDLAPLPAVGGSPGSFANSHHLCLTQRSQEDANTAHAATEFIGWVSRNSVTWAEAGNIPANAAARDDPAFASTRQVALAGDDALDDLVFLPLIPNSRDIAANSYQRAVSEVVIGASSPADAARFAQRTAQDQLDGLRELYGLR